MNTPRTNLAWGLYWLSQAVHEMACAHGSAGMTSAKMAMNHFEALAKAEGEISDAVSNGIKSMLVDMEERLKKYERRSDPNS